MGKERRDVPPLGPPAAPASEGAEARFLQPAPAQAPSPALCRRGVLLMGCGFMGVFGGFQAAQNLQTSLNATLGFVNLAALYGTFTLLCLVAPHLVGVLDSAVGLRLVLLVSSLAYVAMILSNLSVESWALPISMNVLVGVAAPLLWTSQNDYVGRCSYHAAQAEEAARGPDAALAAKTAELNGLFFSLYQLAGLGGNAAASTLMLILSGSALMKRVLFLGLGGVSLAGAASFLCLPRVGPAAAGPEAASPRDTAALAASDARMTCLIPLIFTNGMTLSYIFGDYPAYIVSPVAGPSLVGFVAAAFFGVNALATVLWGRLTSRGHVSRRTAYMVASLCILLFLTITMLWRVPENFQKRAGDWEQVRKPSASQVLVVFLLAALFAIGDAFLESGPIATLQNYFLGTAAALPAMANAKMWQSLGYATQFLLGAGVAGGPVLRAAPLACLCIVSALCLLALDRRAPLH